MGCLRDYDTFETSRQRQETACSKAVVFDREDAHSITADKVAVQCSDVAWIEGILTVAIVGSIYE